MVVDTAARTLSAFGRTLACEIGRAGATPEAVKREGDGMTPLGVYPIRCALFRPDRAIPPAGMRLPWRWTRQADGWSDDSADPLYNRPVRHPWPFSAERMQRADALYDVIVVLGHNDAPVRPGMGSAIFLHCRIAGHATEGCVAIDKQDLLDILGRLSPDDVIAIR